MSMPRAVASAFLCLAALVSGTSGEASSSDRGRQGSTPGWQFGRRDTDGEARSLGRADSERRPGGLRLQGQAGAVPPPGISRGEMVGSVADWLDYYDFVAQVRVRTGGGGQVNCTGIIYRRFVLTAAHCSEDATWYVVFTFNQRFGAAEPLAIHPRRSEPGYDVMVLGMMLGEIHNNRVAFTLRSGGGDDNGIWGRLVGMGESEEGLRELPVVSAPSVATRCGSSYCFGRSDSQACLGDGGGAFLHCLPGWNQCLGGGAGFQVVGIIGEISGVPCAEKLYTTITPTESIKTWLQNVTGADGFPWHPAPGP